MAVRNRQIGWSPMANALYDVLREFNALKGQFAATPTTTTTTTAITIDSTLRVPLNGQESFFDIPFNKCSFGCWIKMANGVAFPRIFSFGQYPSAYQAVSIENDVLYVWYNGSMVMTYTMTSYIGNWVWISLLGSTTGNITLYIDGVSVAFGVVPFPGTPTPEMFIGSENAPGTYYDGLMAGIIFDGGDIDVTVVPTLPFDPGTSGQLFLLLGQGGGFPEQITDLGQFGLSVINTNCTYSTESPYTPVNGGSIKFGA
jgi:hypothetical protein